MRERQFFVNELRNLLLGKFLSWALVAIVAILTHQTATAGMVQIVPQKVYLAGYIAWFPNVDLAAGASIENYCSHNGLINCRDFVSSERYDSGTGWIWFTTYTWTDSQGVDHVGNINSQPGVVAGLIEWECPGGTASYQSQFCSDFSANPIPHKNTGGHSAENCQCKDEVPMAGNPINVGIGNKFQLETDYQGIGSFPLSFKRAYNSVGNTISTLMARNIGKNWRHSYDRAVYVASNGTTSTVTLIRSEGSAIFFTLVNGVWTSDSDVSDKFITLVDNSGKPIGWQYTAAKGDEVEIYNAAGQMTSISNRSGMVQTLSYSGNLLMRVTDNWGRQLNFTYDGTGRILTVTDPIGRKIIYTYTPDANNDQYLSAVTYQDGKSKNYVYAETGYPTSLTGVVDENGARFATFRYDNNNKATSTEHTGGVEKYSVGSASNNTTRTVTDPLGATHIYTFQTILGVLKSTGQSRSGGSGVTAAAMALTYDANGNVATRTDFNGTVTTYSYDLTRNLEISHVEGAGTPQARTITTAWHANFSLPLKLAEPKLLTTYAYDTSGNLLNKTVQATSDATGAQGLSPTLVGTARTWSYTYNSVGQVLTATGPRTDVADTTTYTYDTSGNLSTITNAVGQIMTLSNYDANGRVGLITDANGATTALTYSPRGWLIGKTITSGGAVETTTYDYDGVGQLTLVTLPDASTVSYTYDPAHRLTNIADSLGNSIAYTLDNMGNRTNEQVKDPSGALARQTSRVVDALNRLQQITGAVQ